METEEKTKDLKYEYSIETDYAEMFSIDCYEGGYAKIKIDGEGEFLLVPENMPVPETEDDITVLKQPVEDIYLTAVSVYDMIEKLGESHRVSLTGTKKSSWYMDEAILAMEEDKMKYAGKYSAPDYEFILSENCGLVVASTMMKH
ncbi:MAG: ABC transporter substrate-binding protein, partial [Firmicutes bacterium]|nr:ABC transporter substrate-binding protein [Bacillota bacterium]